MKTLWVSFCALFLSVVAQAADVKLSQLPLSSAAQTHSGDSFPYVNSTAGVTQRLTLFDIVNIPALVSTYAPLASPTFTGTVTAPTFVGAVTGTTTGNLSLASPSLHGVLLSGSANATSALAPNSSTAFPLVSGGASADPVWALLTVAGGGTGAATFASNGMIYGNGTSALGATAAGSQYQVFQAGASGVPTVGAVHLDQATAITGTLPNASTSATSANTVSAIVSRDSNGNTQANNFSNNSTAVTSAGTTTTLTAASARLQVLQGSSNQTFQLPDATTLAIGWVFEFNNNSTGTLTVNDGGGGLVTTIPSGGYSRINAIAVSTAAGSWDKHFLMPANASYGTSGMTVTGTIAATSTLSGTGASFSGLTASQAVLTDGSKNLISLPYATTNTVSSLVERDGSGNFSAGTITAALTGTASGNLAISSNLSDVNNSTTSFNNISGLTTLGDIIYGGASGTRSRLAGNTTTTKKFLTQTGDGVNSVAPGWNTIAATDISSLTNTNLSGSAAISNANLATMASSSSTVGTVKGNISGSSATPSDITLTSANTVSSSVYRDGSGNFSAGTITAALTGTASGNTTLSGQTNHGVVISGSANAMVSTTAGTAGQVLISNGASADPTFQSITQSATSPTIQKLLSTGTTTGYLFTISTSSTVAVGDTYTNNGNTYTVLGALSAQSGQVLFMSQAAAPLASGTLTRATGAGTASITFTSEIALATYTKPTSPAPLYIKVTMVGGGGGGGASSTASDGATGAAGTGSFFGSNLLSAGGGLGGHGGSTGASEPGGGTGGSASLGTGPIGLAINGNGGNYGWNMIVNQYAPGGAGAPSALGGAAQMPFLGLPSNAAANSGAGGGGAGINTGTNQQSGGGGGSGGFVSATILSPSATYPYLVGSGGAGGATGTNHVNGANGGSGIVMVEEFYQ